MKLANVRAQWMVEGKFVACIEAAAQPSNDEMLAYLGLRPGDPLFETHARPFPSSRYVLLRPDGNFIVVPVNPDTREYQ